MSAELKIAHTSKRTLAIVFHKKLNLTRQHVHADGLDLSLVMSIVNLVKSGILIILMANSVSPVTSSTPFLTMDLVKTAWVTQMALWFSLQVQAFILFAPRKNAPTLS